MRIRVLPPVVRAALVVTLVCASVPAFAQSSTGEPAAVGAIAVSPAPLLLDSGPAATQAPPLFRRAQEPRRPSALLPLYGSLITLQALDIHSTRTAIATGSAREMNPAMGPIVHNSAAFLAVKASSTAGLIWISEKLWKQHPRRAVVLAAVVNGAMGAVVAHNYRVRR